MGIQIPDLRSNLHKTVRDYLLGLVDEDIIREYVVFNISKKLENTLLEVFGSDRACKYAQYCAARWVCDQRLNFKTPKSLDKLVLDDFLCRKYVLNGWDNIESRRKTLTNAQFARLDGSVEDAKMLAARFESEYLPFAYASLLRFGKIQIESLNPNPFWTFSSRKLGRFSAEECSNHCPVSLRDLPVVFRGLPMTLEQSTTSITNLYGRNERFYMSVCEALTQARYEWVCQVGALIYCPNLKTDYINRSGISDDLIRVNFEDYLDYIQELKERNEGLDKESRSPNDFLTQKDIALFEWLANWQKRSISTPEPAQEDFNDAEELSGTYFGISLLHKQPADKLDPMLSMLLNVEM